MLCPPCEPHESAFSQILFMNIHRSMRIIVTFMNIYSTKLGALKEIVLKYYYYIIIKNIMTVMGRFQAFFICGLPRTTLRIFKMKIDSIFSSKN